MSFRFRRGIKIAPGLRVNLSKSGVSTSFGVPGASVTFGQRGVYTNVGLPGTGLSYRTRVDKMPAGSGITGTKTPGETKPGRLSEHPAGPGEGNLLSQKLHLTLSEQGKLEINDEHGNPVPAKTKNILWEQKGEELTKWLQEEMDAINGEADLIRGIHREIPLPCTPPPDYTPLPFNEPEPARPRQKLFGKPPQKPVPPEKNLFQRLIPSQTNRLDNAYQQKIAAWEKDLSAYKQQKKQHEDNYKNELAAYELKLQEWHRQKEEHEQAEKYKAKEYTRKLYEDEEFMEDILSAQFQNLSWPWETEVSFQVKGNHADLDVDFPNLEVFPRREATFSANGKRLLIKTKSNTQLRLDYATHIHGIIMRLAGFVFITLPAVNEVVISGYSQRLNQASGYVIDEYLLSVIITREDFGQINLENLALVDPIQALERFKLKRNMTKKGILKPIKPY